MKKEKPPNERAVFLDRDGVLIRHVDLLHKISDVRLLKGAARAVSFLNKLGYLAIVVTNQPVVARGIATEERMDEINEVVKKRFAARGAKLDAIYSCPHHPEGSVKKFRIKCLCRKPEIGMIRDAAKHFGIDMKKSFMVGDATRDILTGNRAGLISILVKTGLGGHDPHQYPGTPDFVAKDLFAAVKFISGSRRK